MLPLNWVQAEVTKRGLRSPPKKQSSSAPSCGTGRKSSRDERAAAAAFFILRSLSSPSARLQQKQRLSLSRLGKGFAGLHAKTTTPANPNPANSQQAHAHPEVVPPAASPLRMAVAASPTAHPLSTASADPPSLPTSKNIIKTTEFQSSSSRGKYTKMHSISLLTILHSHGARSSSRFRSP